MKKFVTLCTAALTLAISTPSFAADKSEVAFTYNPDAAVETTYAKLSKQAYKVCQAELGPFMQYGAADCVEAYMADIIGKINRIDLTAYHKVQTSDDRDVIMLAKLEKDVSEKK